MQRDVLVILVRLAVIFGKGGSNDLDCPSTQLVELGCQGFITCTLPANFSEVYWYDDISGNSDSLPAAAYRIDGNTKYGSGIASGEYDILSNGTLLIRNVTVSHEKQIKVLVCTLRSCNLLSTISVKVLVYPREVTPSIGYCNGRGPCVVLFTQHCQLLCQFDSARPPVDLEWVEQVRGKDVQIESQNSSNELNSDGVTYNSYAILNERVSNDRLLAVYSCKPRWDAADAVIERSILVDFSEKTDLVNQPPEQTTYREINRRAELRCKVSHVSEIIWKNITPNGSVETLAFMFKHRVIHTNEEFTENILLSADGSLIFTSLQLHHEGTYACLYDNGADVKGTQITHLQVLVPPSPPYIDIVECKGASPCIIGGKRKGSLTCVLNGVRPEVSLTWIAENDKLVTLRDFKTVIQNRGQLTDLSVSVSYEIGRDVVCGTLAELQCQVGYPISQIIQPFVKATISPDECTDHHNEGNKRNGFRASYVIAVAVAACIIVVCGVTICRIRFARNHQSLDKQPTNHAVEDVYLMSNRPIRREDGSSRRGLTTTSYGTSASTVAT